MQNLAHVILLLGLAPDLLPDSWLPPIGHHVKLNFDGSFNSVVEHAGIGGIIRNAFGHLLTVFASKVKANHSIEAKLQTLLTGVDLCIRWAFFQSSWKGIASFWWSLCQLQEPPVEFHEELKDPPHTSQIIAMVGNQVLQANS